MSWSGTRRRLVAAAGATAVSLVRLPVGLGGGRLVTDFSLHNTGRPFAGDSAQMTTLGPLLAREEARVRFELARSALSRSRCSRRGRGLRRSGP